MEPKAVACLAQDIDARSQFCDVPPANREVRHRTRPTSCFNNPANIDRIIFAVFHYQNLKHGVSAPSQITHSG